MHHGFKFMRASFWLQLLLSTKYAVAILGYHESATNASHVHPDLLYVFEYDNCFDWTPVYATKPGTAEVVTWLLGLPDRITQTLNEPDGQHLMVWLTSLNYMLCSWSLQPAQHAECPCKFDQQNSSLCAAATAMCWYCQGRCNLHSNHLCQLS